MSNRQPDLNLADVKVGWWYYTCCEHDEYQIETEEELAFVIADGGGSYLFQPIPIQAEQLGE
jgi:hypothetical protein